jgi:glycosyltransferase involved in cell wall biosynthesis
MVAHAFPPQVGGVETHLWNISQRLSEHGHDVRCLVGGSQAHDRYGRVEVIRHPALSVQHLLAARSALGDGDRDANLRAALAHLVEGAMSDRRPDLIHAHNLLHFAPELAEALSSSASGVPVVTSVHDRVGEHLFPEVIAFPWAHTLFASHFLQSNLPPCEPSSVLWLGIERHRFTPCGVRDARFLEMERPIVFHPARLLRWKGVEVGFDAFRLLRGRLGAGTLVMCASENAATDEEEIRSLRESLSRRAAREGLGERVRFLELAQSEMAAAYRGSDLVWYPTIDEEPLGLVPIEAMACGVPLVVTDSGGMRETVIANETGLMVRKNDAPALAAAAERLLLDDVLRRHLVAEGLKRAALFDNRKYVDDLSSLYVRVAGGGSIADKEESR